MNVAITVLKPCWGYFCFILGNRSQQPLYHRSNTINATSTIPGQPINNTLERQGNMSNTNRHPLYQQQYTTDPGSRSMDRDNRPPSVPPNHMGTGGRHTPTHMQNNNTSLEMKWPTGDKILGTITLDSHQIFQNTQRYQKLRTNNVKSDIFFGFQSVC